MAVRVLTLAQDPHVTMGRMAEVIAVAPELSARVLRIVNSALYGFPGEIRSIERATTLLGLQSVKNVAIAASLTRAFHGRPLTSSFSPRDIWTHSLSVAAASRLVALEVRRDLAEEALLGGLLHDVGVMVALQYDRHKVAAVLAELEAEPPAGLLGVEAQWLGATHQDCGAALLRNWKLPALFPLVAGAHHAPLALAPEDRTLPTIVYVGDRLVAALTPFRMDDASMAIDDDALDQLRLTRAATDAIRAVLPSAAQQLVAALG